MSTPESKPVADRPTVDQRDPAELRADLAQQRRELGETVEELVHRVDVPSRAREQKDEAVAQVKQQVAHTTEQVRQQAVRAQSAARTTLHEKAPGVERVVREQPTGLIAAGAAVLLLVLLRKRKRRRARDQEA